MGQTGQTNFRSIVSEGVNKKEDVEVLFVSTTLAVINKGFLTCLIF